MLPRSIHLAMTSVHAADSGAAIASASAYIRDAGRWDVDAGTSVDAALEYMRATGRHRTGNGRVCASDFICRGTHDRARVWREIDDSFRTKTGEYSRRGGNNRRRGDDHRSSGRPRIAIFADATLPRELSEPQKIEAARRLARMLEQRYGCAIELAWHTKAGLIDHFHMLISTRVVDEGGVGPIIREMNGIASKAGAARGEERIAAFPEFVRRSFAETLTEMTGILYDWRSFERQGRTETPTPWIPRKRLESEAKRGTNESMIERRRLLALRAAKHSIARDADRSSLKPAHSLAIAFDAGLFPLHALNPLVAFAVLVQPAPPVLPQSITKRDGRDLGKARDEQEVAALINANVDSELKADAQQFLNEQERVDAIRVPPGHEPQKRNSVQPAVKNAAKFDFLSFGQFAEERLAASNQDNPKRLEFVEVATAQKAVIFDEEDIEDIKRRVEKRVEAERAGPVVKSQDVKVNRSTPVIGAVRRPDIRILSEGNVAGSLHNIAAGVLPLSVSAVPSAGSGPPQKAIDPGRDRKMKVEVAEPINEPLPKMAGRFEPRPAAAPINEKRDPVVKAGGGGERRTEEALPTVAVISDPVIDHSNDTARPLDTDVTVRIAASNHKLRHACIELAAYRLRKGSKKLREDELSVIAGMSPQAFREAMNDRTVMRSKVGIEDLARYLDKVIAGAADTRLSQLGPRSSHAIRPPSLKVDLAFRSGTKPSGDEVEKG